MGFSVAFCTWLSKTGWSIALRESTWAYPIVESIHVLSLCLFVGFAVLLDGRLLGITFRRSPVSLMTQRLLPWTFIGFGLMLLSGGLLFYSDPVRFSNNVFFQIKSFLLLVAGLNAWVFHAGIYRDVHRWDVDAKPPLAARIAGGCSLVLWGSVVVAGRLIAYNWFEPARTAALGN